MSSGQGGLLRAPSVVHSFELGAEALCGRVRFGEGPVEKCLGCPRVGLQAAQGAPEHRCTMIQDHAFLRQKSSWGISINIKL